MEEKKSFFVQRLEKLVSSYEKKFNVKPTDVFSSPGRIEIIGNHLDHNHGSVMVGTIDLSIVAVASKNDDNKIIYVTESFPVMEIELNDLDKRENEYGSSLALIRGVLFKLKELGYKIGGCTIYSSTNIFKGAGVSSSAAFENIIGQIMNHYYNDDKISAIEIAKISQFSEMVYFNKPCGLLDQAGIALGGINYIDFYDIENPRTRKINPIFKKYDFVLVNTRDSHSKLTANYAEITTDMKLISNHYGKNFLIDVNEKDFYDDLEELKKQYGERPVNRARHFFEENKRVKTAFAALKKGDEDLFAKMINESGESSYSLLKNCYVNSEEENLPTAIRHSKEIIKNGAVRVHGGGFAGTILAFVSKEESYGYIKAMRKLYGFNNVKKLSITRFGSRWVGPLAKYLGEENE